MENTLPDLSYSQQKDSMHFFIESISVLERIRALSSVPLPILICLYQGEQPPEYCTKMPRYPEPITGNKLSDLPDIITNVFALNFALHDGAILASRDNNDTYIISGWSYRLHPPSLKFSTSVNKGSAYNSCAAMSAVEGVDAVLVLSESGLYIFVKGNEIKYSTIVS